MSMSISSLLSSESVCSWSWTSLMLPILQDCLLFHFAGPGRSHIVLSDVFVSPPTFALKSPSQLLCNVFAFPGSYQWCCRSCLSLRLSEMSLAHIRERYSVGICLLCVWLVLLLLNSQRILLLCCLSISCLWGKPTPACPLLASVWYSRWPLWRVLNHKPSPTTFNFRGSCGVLVWKNKWLWHHTDLSLWLLSMSARFS